MKIPQVLLLLILVLADEILVTFYFSCCSVGASLEAEVLTRLVQSI